MGPYAQLFQIRVKESGDGYQAQETGSTVVGSGDTVQDAIIDYAEQAKQRVEGE